MGAAEVTRARALTVGDAMTRQPITIDRAAPLGTALATMVERSVRHLPVVDDDGRLVGMLTDRDLRGAILAPAVAEHLSGRWRRRLQGLQQTVEELRVLHVMTWDCVTTSAHASLLQAAARMVDGKFGALPVVDDGRLIGILTEHDVLRAVAGLLPSVRGDADDYFW